MKFHFEFDVKKLPDLIHHQHQLFLIGSCFTENMGEKLRRHKFKVTENPNGILFNPVSVTEALTSYIQNEPVSETALFFYNDAWHSWKHHSRYSGVSKAGALYKINASLAAAHEALKSSSYLIVTLGSAWVYTLTAEATPTQVGTVAANNHKAPANWFFRRLLSAEEVVQCFDQLIHRLKYFNPALQIIFTISPVRHLREGVVENNRSKAVLIQAVHYLVNKFQGLYYFPAYELVIDDLRDYRFYAEDLVHPNYQATQYVWEKFTEACISEKSKKLMHEVASVDLAYRHRPMHPGSGEHKKFLERFLSKTRALQQDHPYLNFDAELQYFEQELNQHQP